MSGGRSVLLGIALVPYLCLAMFSCSPAQSAAKADKPDALRILVGGDLNGYIAPCGCTKPMLGGMTRRASLIRELERSSSLVKVENGDLIESSGRQDQMKAETLVEMLSDLGYDAINAGEQEFMLGMPYVQSLQERSGGRFVSANVVDATGQPVLKPYLVAEKSVDGKKLNVGIVGVLSSQFADTVAGLNPGIEVRPPEGAIKGLLPTLAACEVRILLVQGSHLEAEDLARQFPDFQIVAYAHDDEASTDPVAKSGPTMVCAGKKGRRLGIVTLANTTGRPVSGLEYRKIGPELGDDPATVKTEHLYLERVASENLLSTFPRSDLKPGQGFAGSASCKSCHSEPYAIWSKTAHAKAYTTLLDSKHDRDPECVSCHVVGLDKTGGFVDKAKTPKLAHVGCESCHGPAAQHTSNPAKFPMPKAGEATCKSCHVPEHSPGFDFELYWKSIKH